MADPTTPLSGNDPNAQADESAALAKAQGILAPAKAGPQSYGAGQNPFTAAANNVDAQKANMLSAIANGGSAGRAMLDQANAALASGRQNAVQAALSAAATRGAPQAMQAQISNTVGSAGQQYGADLAQAGKDFTENQGIMAKGLANYAQMAKQAVPVIQANTDNSLSAKRADAMAKLASGYQAAVDKATQAGLTAQQDQALKNIQLQIANAQLANTQAKGTGANANLITIPTDPGQAAVAAAPAIPAVKANTKFAYQGAPKGSTPAQVRAAEKAFVQSHQVDADGNPLPGNQSPYLPASKGKAAVQGQAARAPQSQSVKNTPAGIRSTTGPKGYGQAVQDALYGAQQGHSETDIQAGLLKLGYSPVIVTQVMSDVRGNFGTNPKAGK